MHRAGRIFSKTLDSHMVWPYHHDMATMTIKTTYALDVETMRILDDLARVKGISRSAALRDAIRCAAALEPAAGNPGLEALDRLQATAAPKRNALRAWKVTAHEERRAASAKREKSRR
jgi:hypothetical protein